MNDIAVSKRLAFINIIVSAVFLIAVTIFLIFAVRPSFSETERRNLAKMPEFSWETYFSGEYMRDISVFYNDTVPGRDYFKTLSARFRGLFGISWGGAEFYFDTPIIKTPPAETTAETTAAPINTETEDYNNVVSSVTDITEAAAQTEKAENSEDTEIEIDNNIFVLYIDGHWRAMPRFFGGSGEIYTNSLNAYKKDLGDNVSVYSMIIPTQEEYYLPDKYKSYIASHYETIININKKLSGIIPVDAYSILNSHKNEEIYTRTDHHWQPLGAYYAAKEFAETAGVPFADISSFAKVEISDYLGTLYGQTQSPKLLADPEIFTYYKPQNDYTAYYYTTDYVFEYQFPLFVEQPVSQSYSIFMGGDNKIVRIETDVKNGKKLAVWKDSYGNALIPFLTSSFEEIYVLDVRYFKLNAVDFMKEHEITDVLFTMCTFTAADSAKAKLIEENRVK